MSTPIANIKTKTRQRRAGFSTCAKALFFIALTLKASETSIKGITSQKINDQLIKGSNFISVHLIALNNP